MRGRRNRSCNGGMDIHAAERFEIRQAELERRGLSGREIKNIMRRHFCSNLIWIHGGFVLPNHIFVKSVFHIRRAVAPVEQTRVVGFVLSKKKLRLASRKQPPL